MTILGNGTLLTNAEDFPVIRDGAVAVEGKRIHAVGSTANLRAKFPGHEFIDAGGRLIMPGLVNAHHHFYSAFARGMMTRNPKTSHNFMEVLENLWWPLDAALTAEDVQLSAEISLVESIKCGVTSVIDHHASYGAIDGSLVWTAEAARRIGARVCLCFEVSDRTGPQATAAAIEENRRFLEGRVGKDDGMLAGLFGLHASFTLSDDTLREAKAAAGNAGFHIHVAEGAADQAACQETHGKRVVQRLADLGILGKDTLAVHCIHIDESEMAILKETETTVVHNPQSNMNNAVGCSPVQALLDRGVRVGLGTDGYTHDLFESAKAAVLLQKHQLGDPAAMGSEPWRMLLQENPRIAGRLFGTTLGVLTEGAAADVLIVDYKPYTELTVGNILGHLQFGLYGSLVRSVMIAGKFVMKDRRMLTIDEDALIAKTRTCAGRLWQRL